MPLEDLRGQREALTEDMESGGEQDTPAAMGDAKTELAKQNKTLRDSALPVVMIAGLLLTFGALAATAIFVVSQAFGDKDDRPALIASNATR